MLRANFRDNRELRDISKKMARCLFEKRLPCEMGRPLGAPSDHSARRRERKNEAGHCCQLSLLQVKDSAPAKKPGSLGLLSKSAEYALTSRIGFNS